MIPVSLENLKRGVSLCARLKSKNLLLSSATMFSSLVITMGCKKGLSHLILLSGLPQVCFIQVLLVLVFKFPLNGGSGVVVFGFALPLAGIVTISSWFSSVASFQ